MVQQHQRRTSWGRNLAVGTASPSGVVQRPGSGEFLQGKRSYLAWGRNLRPVDLPGRRREYVPIDLWRGQGAVNSFWTRREYILVGSSPASLLATVLKELPPHCPESPWRCKTEFQMFPRCHKDKRAAAGRLARECMRQGGRIQAYMDVFTAFPGQVYRPRIAPPSRLTARPLDRCS